MVRRAWRECRDIPLLASSVPPSSRVTPTSPSTPVRFLEFDITAIPVVHASSLTLRIGEVTIDVPQDFDPALLRQVVAVLTTGC